jgi:hypothetical protein
MPSARYYREQAQVLLGWALTTSDAEHATLLTTRAMDLLARSKDVDDAQAGADLNQAIMDFNDQQMRNCLTQHHQPQQQQQVQPKEEQDQE